jgi:hypothetical protein
MCVVAFANTAYKVFRVDSLRSAFIASLILSFVQLFVLEPDIGDLWIEVPIALFNACILFCTATGMNDLVAIRQPTRRGFTPTADSSSRWFHRWLR